MNEADGLCSNKGLLPVCSIMAGLFIGKEYVSDVTHTGSVLPHGCTIDIIDDISYGLIPAFYNAIFLQYLIAYAIFPD